MHVPIHCLLHPKSMFYHDLYGMLCVPIHITYAIPCAGVYVSDMRIITDSTFFFIRISLHSLCKGFELNRIRRSNGREKGRRRDQKIFTCLLYFVLSMRHIMYYSLVWFFSINNSFYFILQKTSDRHTIFEDFFVVFNYLVIHTNTALETCGKK